MTATNLASRHSNVTRQMDAASVEKELQVNGVIDVPEATLEHSLIVNNATHASISGIK